MSRIVWLVTVGGAIANDVHGKNHHRSGTFGRHVVDLELARSISETAPQVVVGDINFVSCQQVT